MVRDASTAMVIRPTGSEGAVFGVEVPTERQMGEE